ncbi:preprotein translocase subunit TatA [Microbacterium sp. CH12i]|uniref:twin-arginine translocase TatA/TatE family subunit n=1 Tax=Microbacterium sp. CH12i TaxID=1479651 RepID=UPI0004617E33|nr:twin-arginine translocase TatA/TatE family subunit [Microbacterium sp. CH12i]KDA05696.1 preprotein translocase subunit TatA [Microbacterium sp. CH12i]
MMAGLTGWHLLVLVLVILLLFGAAKLPALAKSMGQSARVFKGEMKAMKEEDGKSEQAVADVTTTTTSSEPGATPGSDSRNTTS